jgi:IS30 family transposase
MPSVDLAPLSGRYRPSSREEIALLRASGSGVHAIARRLHRAPSTISRELRRNAATRGGYLDYRALTAQWHADRRARRPKPAKLAVNDSLRKYVQDRLAGAVTKPDGTLLAGPNVRWIGRRHGRRQDRRWAMSWSPEQIAHRLQLDFPDDPSMRISHEAIYQALYVQGRGALRRELSACLRTGRALRVPRARTHAHGKGFISDEVLIRERPAEANDRAVPGHWEGDLIIGKQGRSAIGTLVERKTRYLILMHLNGQSAEEVEKAMVAATKRLPQTLWKSLTWDQGSEMRNHAKISVATDLEIYFCDPAKPWQRGSNENTNGLLRQYFPKSTDLSVHSPEHLEFVSAQMNRRPRKTLNWLEPREVLAQLLSESPRQPLVATTE